MFNDLYTKKDRLGTKDLRIWQMIIILTILFVAIVGLTIFAEDRQINAKCEKLAIYQQEYPHTFYYTKEQWEMCNK